MPRVSVVVPIYNVERYLVECLESLAQQTLSDLEVVMVDDGSTDSSAPIAAAFAENDDRFVLVRQPNGGLGNARNTGADRATGDYLAFVDSDDIVTRTRLRDARRLPRPHRLRLRHRQLPPPHDGRAPGRPAWSFTAFNAARPGTHVTKHPALLNDRTAWNKLFRRTFWDEHGFRWPEGVLYEDIPVTLPAHVLARAVDVIREPVYLWRARVGDSTSITQRRTETRAIRDRFSAVDGVSRFMAERGEDDLKARYDRSVAEQDLKYFLQQLDEADDEFRDLFLDLVNDYFDRAAAGRLRRPARTRPPQVAPGAAPPDARAARGAAVRARRRDRLDPGGAPRPQALRRLPVPRRRGPRDPGRASTGSARTSCRCRARIEDVWWDGDVLRLKGYAYIAFQELPTEKSGRIRLTLEESGHPDSVIPLEVRRVRRPDVTEAAPDGVTNYDGSGWEAAVPVSAAAPPREVPDRQLAAAARGPGQGRHPAPVALRHRPGPGQAAGLADRRRRADRPHHAGRQLRRRDLDHTCRGRGHPGRRHGARAHRHPARPPLRPGHGVAACCARRRHLLGGPAGRHRRVAVRRQHPVRRAGRHQHPRQTRTSTRPSRTAATSPTATSGASRCSPTATGARISLSAGSEMPQPRLTRGDTEVLVHITRTGRPQVIGRHPRPEVEGVSWSDDGTPRAHRPVRRGQRRRDRAGAQRQANGRSRSPCR